MRSMLMPLILVTALFAGCATVVNPVTGREERTVMDEASELAEGRKAHQQVLAEYGVYGNPRLQAYVNDIGLRLARQSHRSQLQWTFTVLDSPEINAFALPGGYVYVTRGIRAYMESEADLAGVIGHVTARSARRGSRRPASACWRPACSASATWRARLLVGCRHRCGRAGLTSDENRKLNHGRRFSVDATVLTRSRRASAAPQYRIRQRIVPGIEHNASSATWLAVLSTSITT